MSSPVTIHSVKSSTHFRAEFDAVWNIYLDFGDLALNISLGPWWNRDSISLSFCIGLAMWSFNGEILEVVL